MDSEIITISDGREVELVWEDDGEVSVWTRDNKRQEIGSFVFEHIEGADPHGKDDYYLVINMHLEGPNGQGNYIKKGIGRAIISKAKDYYGHSIVFSADDGIRRGNGSHLTAIGPLFASAMVDEGLAYQEKI